MDRSIKGVAFEITNLKYNNRTSDLLIRTDTLLESPCIKKIIIFTADSFLERNLWAGSKIIYFTLTSDLVKPLT